MTPAAPEWVGRLPEALRGAGWMGLEPWQWLGLPVAAAVAWAVGLGSSAVIARLAGLRRRLAAATVSPETSRAVRRSASFLVAVLVLEALLDHLALGKAVLPGLNRLILVVETGALAWFVAAIWDLVVDHVAARQDTTRRAVSLAVPFLRRFVRAAIWGFGGLIAASLLGYDVRALLAGLGIGGLAVALAGKESLENLFGAVTIMADLPFGVGDWVRIGDVEGTVEEINLRSTRIRTFEDSLITLPNSNLIKASVNNMGMRRMRRIRFSLWVEPGTDPDALERLAHGIQERFAAEPNLKPDSAWAALTDVTLDGLQLTAQGFYELPDFAAEVALRQNLVLDTLRRAQALGVPLAEPRRR